ncbi:hypothetical protein [Aldersonia kunmingensis]|uniref:putative acetyltransferase n=1 Tax=Aldersonia kunmingensis TaxID=408066 RepID=UPI00082E08FA|nr:hypothetical protein [Aldersonia kunmingensis]
MTMNDIPLGTRVVIRYRRPDGSTPPLTDVIGELLGHDPLIVLKADGESVEVPRDRVLRMKVLGPRPERRPSTSD